MRNFTRLRLFRITRWCTGPNSDKRRVQCEKKKENFRYTKWTHRLKSEWSFEVQVKKIRCGEEIHRERRG